MRWLGNLFRIERRAAPTSWDLISGRHVDPDIMPVGPHFSENLSAVFACVQAISETIASLPLKIYRRQGDGRYEARDHPVSRLFARDPNELQTSVEFIEMLTAHCLLRGNSFAEIERNNRGAPTSLVPLHPDNVAVLRLPSGRLAYEVSNPAGDTRRVLADEMLHLKDRSDDGIVGKSRLARARETFATAAQVETFTAATYRNGAALSGVLQMPESLSEAAAKRLKSSFEQYVGARRAGQIAVLEEGLKWQAISVSPMDAQMLDSRRFSVEQIARIFRVPPPIVGDLSHGTYANAVEMHKQFYSLCIRPWLTRWEKVIERSLFSEDARRTHEVEFDADLLTRTDMLARYQSYRIAREIGLLSANEIRAFENLNPRTDAAADAYLSPLNMQPEQVGAPKADRDGQAASAPST